ncbi:MAG: polysaccharide biosynthesis protein GtrA [Actinomycetales bacterium]|nr:MAG: polysaccharide biosynthesis protein GtrA [Actinomycetales bacterium]
MPDVTGATDPTFEPGPRGWLFTVVRHPKTAFLLVGGVNTAIGVIAFFGFDDLWRALAPQLAGVVHNTAVLACAHIASVFVAFVLYRTLVFRVRGHVLRDLGRFESVYLASIAVNWVLLNLLVEVAGLVPKLAQTIIVVLQAVWSWFAHKHFSFRRSPNERGERT